MTYNVFGGTLNPSHSFTQVVLQKDDPLCCVSHQMVALMSEDLAI